MMPWPKDAAVIRDLQHLMRNEYLAVINNDRDTMVVYRVLWLRRYCEALGIREGNMLKLADLMRPPESWVAPMQPAWKTFQRARPLRTVVKRTPSVIQFGDRQKAIWFRDLLSCGHEVNIPADVFGNKPPKRRRCAQCATQTLTKELEAGRMHANSAD
jgi:hypothetical protein